MGLDAMTAQKEMLEKNPLEQAVADELVRIQLRRHEIMQGQDKDSSNADQTIRGFADVNLFYGELVGMSKLEEASGISKGLAEKISQEILALGITKDILNGQIRKLRGEQ